jgi:hypothetical protein
MFATTRRVDLQEKRDHECPAAFDEGTHAVGLSARAPCPHFEPLYFPEIIREFLIERKWSDAVEPRLNDLGDRTPAA